MVHNKFLIYVEFIQDLFKIIKKPICKEILQLFLKKLWCSTVSIDSNAPDIEVEHLSELRTISLCNVLIQPFLSSGLVNRRFAPIILTLFENSVSIHN